MNGNDDDDGGVDDDEVKRVSTQRSSSRGDNRIDTAFLKVRDDDNDDDLDDVDDDERDTSDDGDDDGDGDDDEVKFMSMRGPSLWATVRPTMIMFTTTMAATTK